MRRVSLEYCGDQLRIKFKYKKRIIELLKQFPVRFDKENECNWAPRSSTRSICRAFRKHEVYMKLSKEIADEFGVTETGFTEEEIAKRRDLLRCHRSNAVEDKDFDVDGIKLLDFEKSGKRPFPFQVAGISYGVSLGGRVLIGDEMGLGKTIQGISLMSYYAEDFPAVVIAPCSLLYNWKKEIIEITKLTDKDISVMESKSDKPYGSVTICSYSYATDNSQVLSSYMGLSGIVLVDESHNIKTQDSQRSLAIRYLCNVAKRCFLISGTAVLNRPAELFSQLNALDPARWDDFEEFAKKYCDAEWTRYGLDTSGASNLLELNSILIDNYMYRRKKAQVLTQLPPKRRYTKYLSCSKIDAIEELKVVAMDALKNNRNDVAKAKKYILENANFDVEDCTFNARSQTAERKVDQTLELLEDYFSNEDCDPIIVFCHHSDFISAIDSGLNKMKKPPKRICIDGSVAPKTRFELTEKFQTDPDVKLALLSIEAASVGLTLTRASTVYMAEMPWTPGLAQQAEDRAHRISQTKDVDIYYLILENSYDYTMWKLITSKSDMANLVLDGGIGAVLEEDGDIIDDPEDILNIALIAAKREMEGQLEAA